jgi:hypothetical protein
MPAARPVPDPRPRRQVPSHVRRGAQRCRGKGHAERRPDTRKNAVTEHWVLTCRRELHDRTLIWDQAYLLHALRQFEHFYNARRPHQGIASARPLHPLPRPRPRPRPNPELAADTGLDIRTRPPRWHPLRITARRMTSTDIIVSKDRVRPAKRRVVFPPYCRLVGDVSRVRQGRFRLTR